MRGYCHAGFVIAGLAVVVICGLSRLTITRTLNVSSPDNWQPPERLKQFKDSEGHAVVDAGDLVAARIALTLDSVIRLLTRVGCGSPELRALEPVSNQL